jgi:ketol-acid reductoisomerase
MGEQTILCGMLQTGSLLCFDRMVELGCRARLCAKARAKRLGNQSRGLKHGGITNMMDRLTNPAKIRAYDLAEDMKEMLRPLFEKHQDDIMSGHFSSTMMADWANDDVNLLTWRAETNATPFEEQPLTDQQIDEQTYYDQGILMVAMVKAGVELAFETMVSAGIIDESAYYESLHETPLIANTIARKKLYEMNVVISDTAEYGCYLFDQAARPLLKAFVAGLDADVIGSGMTGGNAVDNKVLIAVNAEIRNHPVEVIGEELRDYMTGMQAI